jgi:PhnB protein
VPIQRLAEEIGESRRHFSGRFRDAIGVTPKSAARLFRFERACRLIKDERPSLARVAASCGYFDLAHMSCHFYKTTKSGAATMSMMNLHPRIGLSFDGQCEAAFQFYERCLNGKIAFMLRWGESPMAKDAPAEWSEKILHATLVIGDTTLLGSDAFPGSYESPRGFSILLGLHDASKAERLFGALAENGTVRMPLQETFWAHRFGVLTDQFGIPWDINCEKSE